jgi:hypothetical protein
MRAGRTSRWIDYALGLPGERAYGQVTKNLTLIASMSLYGMGESMCIEGATDARAFEPYVEHFLAPKLSEGQVVVLDKLGAHKEMGAHRSQGCGAGVFCPPILRI